MTHFLDRLKRRAGTVIGLGLVLLAVTPLLANQYSRWRTDREWGRAAEARRQAEQAALAAIRRASPDPMARLTERGVSMTAEAALTGTTLKVDYRLTAAPPASQAMTTVFVGERGPLLLDPASGKELGQARESGSGTAPDGSTGYMAFERVTSAPARVQAQLPHVLVYLKPERQVRWELNRPELVGSAPINQRFTVAGVEFEVEQVRFTERTVQVDYRQITDAAQTGQHFLTFRLSDRLGSVWGGDYPLRDLPDPSRPSQSFDFVGALSRQWVLQVQAAVLVVPGPAIPVEVK